MAYGCAKVLVHAPGGFRLATVGVVVGVLIRPNELLVVLGGFAVALMIRPPGDGREVATIKRVGGLLFMGFLLGRLDLHDPALPQARQWTGRRRR